MNLFRNILLPTLALGLLGSLLPTHVVASGGLRTVAIAGHSGDDAPGTSENFSHLSAITLTLNDRGQAQFQANLHPSGDNTIFSEGGSNGLALVARTGDAAPGTDPNVNFDSFTHALLNSSGQTAFLASLTNSDDLGVFSEGNGNGLTLVARAGEAAPDTDAGVNFAFPGTTRQYRSLAFNERGQTAFIAGLSGPGVSASNFFSIFSEGSGNGLALVAREGDAAPGSSPGVNFNLFNPPRLNRNGQTAFFALLTGTGVVESNDSGVFSEGGGNGLALVARDGDAAPGVGAGVNFDLFAITTRFPQLAPAFNSNGHAAFVSGLAGIGIDLSNGAAIFSEGDGNGLALVTRAGDAAPGTDIGVSFSGFDPASLNLNDSGLIAFSAFLTGAGTDNLNSRGVFSQGSGNGLSLIARAGNAAPDTDLGINFSSFNFPALNNRGQVAFGAHLTGVGVDRANNFGIFAEDLEGNLILIAREGELLDVSDDPLAPDLRRVSSLNYRNVEGFGSFNDLGQLAFHATFTDGSSGIFVSNLVAVPEPNSLALFVLAALAMSQRRQ